MPNNQPPDPTTTAPTKLNGTLFGIDFGLKRIGLATGHTQTALAHPHSTLLTTAPHIPPALDKLIREWQPAGFIIGYPTHADDRNTPHPFAKHCTQFAHLLAQTYKKPIALINEQLSSYAAETHYQQSHGTTINKRNKAALDAYAAQQILQDFFDGSPPIAWITASTDPDSLKL